MADCVITAKLPPLIDPTRTPLAYGNRALPRLNRELVDSSLLLRQRALRSLTDHLHDPEHIAEAISVGIIQNLKQLLTDADDTIRELTTLALSIVTTHAIGRESLIEGGVLTQLSILLDDSSDMARKNSHITFRNIAEMDFGAETIVNSNLISTFVLKAETELDEIKSLALDTLHFLLRINPQAGLDCAAMEVFTKLLYHDLSEIRAKAARDIMDLSVLLDGKEKAVECGTMVPLVKLLRDDNSDVRANSAGAIMFITITTKGKYTALMSDALEPLITLVDDTSYEVRLNAIKALTCLSEAPEGRKALLTNVEQIENHFKDPIPIVVKAAIRASEVIRWLPGDPYYARPYLY